MSNPEHPENNGSSSAGGVIELRKYPNRRYYDTTRSQHVTLEDIYRLIRSGRDVRVTDSKSGEDITAKVLAQIILDHDPPKLGLFPVALLHELIRANEPLVRDFVEKYFNQALRAFLATQEQFDQYLRQSLGLSRSLPFSGQWARMMMGPFAVPGFENRAPENGRAAGAEPDRPSNDELQRSIQELQEQVARLRRQLDETA
jgi:polyhydroxyalkanoate synthesis repressor PhaR